MRLEKEEKLEVQNLMKLIRRAKFDDLQGLEALALARAYSWLDEILKQSEAKVQGPIEVVQEDPMNPFDEQLAKQEPKKKGRAKK